MPARDGAAGVIPLGIVVFVLTGAIQALYGPFLPAFHTALHVDISSAGLLLTGHFTGEALGVLFLACVGSQAIKPKQLAAALIPLLAGCLLLAVAPTWPIAVTGAVSIGVGTGVLVVGFNTLFASAFGNRGASLLNILNAAFGVGSLAAPLAAGIADGQFRPVYLTAAAGAALLLPLLLRMEALPVVTERRSFTSPIGAGGTLLLFGAIFAFYVGLEADVGGWESAHLLTIGWSHRAAAAAPALFWAALTLGRLVAAPLSQRVGPQRIILGGLAVACLLSGLAHIDGLAPFAYTLTGLAIAPIFPLSFLWLKSALPDVPSAPSLAMLGALMGGAFFPFVVGRLIGANSPRVLPAALALLAATGFVLVLALRKLQGGTPRTAVLSRGAGSRQPYV